MRVEDQKGLEIDAIGYAQAIEAMYGCIVVLRLTPAGKASRSTWRVEAVAYLDGDRIPTNGAIQRGVSYPSAHHKTFGGASLKALADLEEALRAYWTLKGMRYEEV